MHRRKTLTLGLAAAALAACGLAYAFDADPPEPTAQVPVPTRIDCVGTRCGGNGGPVARQWSYWVQPETTGIHTVEIGTDLANLNNVTNVVMPATWSLQLLPGDFQDGNPFVAHGQYASPNDTCDNVLVFSGPTQTQYFQLGFDGGKGPHQVDWQVLPVNVGTGMAAWGRPVGTGLGPVHAPAFAIGPNDQPSESCADEVHAH